MAVPVKLDDIIEGMEFQGPEHHCYLNKKTGQVVTISDEEFRAVEDGRPLQDFPEWQQDMIKVAKGIWETDDYVALPDDFDIDEYRLMQRFCSTIDDDEIREEMYFAIDGPGAFRMFKHNIHKYGIADEWYKFRDEALRQIAIDWCEYNEIPFIAE